MSNKPALLLLAGASAALVTGAALAASAVTPVVERQVQIPVRILEASRVENVSLASLAIPAQRPLGRFRVDMPTLGEGDRAFGAATFDGDDLVIVVVLVDPTPTREPFRFREQTPPLLPPGPTPEDIVGIDVRGLPSPSPRRGELYAGYGFLDPHKAPSWCGEAPPDFLPALPMAGLRRDASLTSGAIDVLCNRSSSRADRFRAIFKPQVKPLDFSISLTFDWNHGVGRSNVCGLLATTPAQAGAQAKQSITKPDGTTESKSFALDAKGTAITPYLINAYGTYKFDVEVTAGGTTKSTTGQTTVTATPGQGLGCPPPPP